MKQEIYDSKNGIRQTLQRMGPWFFQKNPAKENSLRFVAVRFPYELTADDVYDDFIYLCYIFLSYLDRLKSLPTSLFVILNDSRLSDTMEIRANLGSWCRLTFRGVGLGPVREGTF